MNLSTSNFKAFFSYCKAKKGELIMFSAFVLAALLAAIFLLSMSDVRDDYPNMMSESVMYLNSDVEVLLLGDSHIYSSLNPEEFNFKVMNLSAPYINYSYQLALLKKYLPKLENLKAVGIEVSGHNLLVDTAENRNGDFSDFYDLGLTAFDFPSMNYLEQLNIHIMTNSFTGRLFRGPKFSYKELTTSNTAKKNITPGHLTQPEAVFINSESAPNIGGEPVEIKTLIELSKYFESNNSINENYQSLIGIVDLLKSKDIEVFLILFPSFDPQVNNDSGIFYKFLQNNNDFQIQNFNILNISNDREFTNKYFYDKTHLNQAGANKFQNVFRDFLKKKLNFTLSM